MPRPKKEVVEEKTEIKEEEVVTLAKEFEYENTGNLPYNLSKNIYTFDLKAQVPFRMVPGDIKMMNTGIKVRIPEGFIGIIHTDDQINIKTQVCVFGSPIILVPELEAKEVAVALKMFGTGYKIFNMGDKIASFTLIPTKEVKTDKK